MRGYRFQFGMVHVWGTQAAEAVTLGDLEQLLEELRLLLPSTGSLLQQLLQEGPMLRSALLQAELLLGRLDGINLRVRPF